MHSFVDVLSQDDRSISASMLCVLKSIVWVLENELPLGE